MCQMLSLGSFMLLNVFTLNLSSKWLMTYLLLIWIHFSCYYSAVGFHNWSVLLQITFGWVSFLQDSLAYGGGATIRHFYILMGHLSLTFIINMFTKTYLTFHVFQELSRWGDCLCENMLFVLVSLLHVDFWRKDRLFNQMCFIPKLLEMYLCCGAQVCFLEFFPWHILVFLCMRTQHNIHPSQLGNPSNIEDSSKVFHSFSLLLTDCI